MSIPSETPISENELAPGIRVAEILKPESVEKVSGILQTATRDQASIVPFGGCHSLATGHPVATAQLGLDLTGMSGVIAYEPADLTISVRSGTTFSHIQRELGAHGQELSIDVPNPETTTVGGIVATGFAGPRRLRSGSLRDLLIGCDYVRGDGLVAKAGGMVVKNVSGFEIPRFLHGSWGALAIVTSVNLKVTPKPRADGTIVAEVSDMAAATGSALTLIATEPSIEACVVIRAGDSVRIAARAVGRAAAVAETLGSFERTLGSAVERLDAGASAAFWQDHVNKFAESDDAIVIALKTRSRDIGTLAARVDEFLHSGAEIVVSPGMGALRVVVREGDGSDVLRGIAGIATSTGATYVVESSPPSLKTMVPPWGPAPEGLEIMRAVKREFDPAGVLNPGRLFV